MSTLTSKLINLAIIAAFLAFSLVTGGFVSALSFIVAAIAVIPLLTPEPTQTDRAVSVIDKVIQKHPEIFRS